MSSKKAVRYMCRIICNLEWLKEGNKPKLMYLPLSLGNKTLPVHLKALENHRFYSERLGQGDLKEMETYMCMCVPCI